MSSNDDKMRSLISAVFAFLVCLIFSCILICAGSLAALFNTSHLENSLEKSGYGAKNFQALQESLAEEARVHGMPEAVLLSELDRKTFDIQLDSNIGAAYSGSVNAPGAETTQWRQQIRQQIEVYLKKQQVGDNERIKAAVDEIVKNAGSYYESYTSFPFASYFARYQKQALKLVKVLIPAGCLLAAILIFVLLRLQETAYRGWYYVISALLGAGLLCIISGMVLGFGTDYEYSADMIGYQTFIDTFFSGAAGVFCAVGSAAVLAVIVGFWILRRYEKEV